jgi:transcription elongation factor Elf1
MPDEFACPNCHCQSVVYPDDTADDDTVLCRSCGTVLGTLNQFRRYIERWTQNHGPFTTGC